jgi:hypothetical protein
MAAVKITPPNDFPLGLIRSHLVVIHLFLMLCDLQKVVRDICPILYIKFIVVNVSYFISWCCVNGWDYRILNEISMGLLSSVRRRNGCQPVLGSHLEFWRKRLKLEELLVGGKVFGGVVGFSAGSFSGSAKLPDCLLDDQGTESSIDRGARGFSRFHSPHRPGD